MTFKRGNSSWTSTVLQSRRNTSVFCSIINLNHSIFSLEQMISFVLKKTYISFCSNALKIMTSSQGQTVIKSNANWPSIARNKRNRSSASCTESTTHVLKIWQQLIHCKEEGQLLKKLRVADQLVLISRYQGVGEGILYLP